MFRGSAFFPLGLRRVVWIVALTAFVGPAVASAELPSPVLNGVFPPGGRAGTTVTVAVEGSSLEGLTVLRFADPRIVAEKEGASQFRVILPSNLPPGLIDVRAIGTFGVSSPRAFCVSRLAERVEAQANDDFAAAEPVALDSTVNGRIEKPSDVDCYRFEARAGQRVVVELHADRIDSQLRGVIEVYDAAGKRLAVSRGYAGVDPLVDLLVPADGAYVVKLFDLSFAGSASHFYRLDIDTGPRVEFAFPPVVRRGTATRVTLYGRNLGMEGRKEHAGANETGGSLGRTEVHPTEFDRVEVDVTPPEGNGPRIPSLRIASAGVAGDLFAYHYPGAQAPVLLSTTEVEVVRENADNHSAAVAQPIEAPCEIAGRLVRTDEQDWYSLQARRGEVLWLEGFGERIGSPVDLDLAVLDEMGTRELARFVDCVENPTAERFPLNHLDPAGRWVAPADGRYRLLIRNLNGGTGDDPRRVYRLSVRREEPDFHLAAVPRRDQPAAMTVWRGGREMLEVVAVRRRGMTGPIRVTAENLPAGMECPETWLGPGVDRAPLIVTVGRDAPPFTGALALAGHADAGGATLTRPVRGGTAVSNGAPNGFGRLTDEVALAVGPATPVVLNATLRELFPGDARSAGGDPLVFQGSVLDVVVDVDQRFQGPGSAVQLTAVELPKLVQNSIAAIPAGRSQGWISFHLPLSLPPGPYTFAIQGTLEVPASAVSPEGKGMVPVTVVSNPITIRVAEARIDVTIDPRAPRKISRGQTIQLNFATERLHGFIGKIHTELVAPEGVTGLRARGVTLVGQTGTGVLQVIANDDAPLGVQPFLRLDALGTVEDRPTYRAGRFWEVEITE